MCRYTAIVHPLNTKLALTHNGSKLAVALIWAVSGVVCFPILTVIDVTNGACHEDWSKTPFRDAGNYLFSVGFVILQFFLPLMALVITYGAIAVDLWRPKAIYGWQWRASNGGGANFRLNRRESLTELGRERREAVKKVCLFNDPHNIIMVALLKKFIF